MNEQEQEIIALIDKIENKIREGQHNGISECKRLEIEYLIEEIVESYKHGSVDDLIEECYEIVDSL